MRSASSSALLGLALLAAPAARALDAAPEAFVLMAEPGGKVRAKLDLRNDGPSVMRVTVGLAADDAEAGAAWLSASRSDFKLPAGARRAVRLSGRLPAGAAEWRGRVVVRGRELREDTWYEVRLSRPVRVRVPALEKCGGALDVAARADGEAVVVDGVFRNEGNVSVTPRFLAERDGLPAPLRLDAAKAVAPAGTAPVSFRLPAGGKAVTVSAFFPAPDGTIRVERRVLEAGR